MNQPIYMDYNATTPMHCEVKAAIMEVLTVGWGNPSSSYGTGQKAAQFIRTARARVGAMIGSADPESEITFTSGGTESNHLALWSAVQAFKLANGNALAHVITTNIEHVAINLPLKDWVRKGLIEVSFVPVECGGRVDTRNVMEAIRDNTCLITVMAANNETGVIQPIVEICEQVKMQNACRPSPRMIRVHTDASQIFGKVAIPQNGLPVDYLTVCGHKFYGPRIGALFHRKGSAPIHPFLFGGGQEHMRRPGTENTPMIAGLGMAAEMVTLNATQWMAHMERVKALLEQELKLRLGDVYEEGSEYSVYKTNFPGGRNAVLPNTLSIRLVGFEGWRVLQECKNLEASTASACHSGACATPSPVLMNSGLTPDQAMETIRLSLGCFTSDDDVKRVAHTIHQACKVIMIRRRLLEKLFGRHARRSPYC